MVDTSSGMATSLAPRKAASCGIAPRPRCRWVFSRQMMALSIIGPIASVIPASVMTLIVCPAKYSAADEAMIEIGSVMMAMAVIRISPRNIRITSEQRIAPSTPSCTSAMIELFT